MTEKLADMAYYKTRLDYDCLRESLKEATWTEPDIDNIIGGLKSLPILMDGFVATIGILSKKY